MRRGLFLSMIVASGALGGGVLAQQPGSQPPPGGPLLTQVQAMCKWLCGKTWKLSFKNAAGSETRVTYTYRLDEMGTVLEGRGYFVPGAENSWIDRHYFMADPGNGQVRYVGVSPKAGMTAGTVSLQFDGFTILVNPLNQPQQFGRLVHRFPDPRTQIVTIFQSADGFTKPSATITMRR